MDPPAADPPFRAVPSEDSRVWRSMRSCWTRSRRSAAVMEESPEPDASLVDSLCLLRRVMISPRRSSVSRPLAAAAASAAISADDLPAPPGCVGERGRGARQGRERRLVNRAWTNFPFRARSSLGGRRTAPGGFAIGPFAGLTFHVEVIHREEVFAELDVRLHLFRVGREGGARGASEGCHFPINCPLRGGGEFVPKCRARAGHGTAGAHLLEAEFSPLHLTRLRLDRRRRR